MTPPDTAAPAATKTFVLDTSVLLSDPRAMLRFAEHEVVLPVVVVTELEGKRHHPELGLLRPAGAAAARRPADQRGPARRAGAGRRATAAPCASSSTTPTRRRCPPASASATTTRRILAVAKNLANEGRDVTVVSKDLPMRVKASAVGLDAEEYRAELAVDSGWTGMAELDVTVEEMDALYDEGRVEHARRPRAAVPHRPRAALARAAAASAGSAPTSRSGWSAATATRSGCTAAAPSSGSPSTCCSTPTSASSASAAGPAPARARSRCAPASRR